MELLAALVTLGILGLAIFFKTARIIIGLTLLGAALGGAGYAIAVQPDVFPPWEPLGTPPSGAVEIVQLASERIYVKAADGEVYSCDVRSQNQCWVMVNPLDPGLKEGSWSPPYFWGAPPEVSVSERSASVREFSFEGTASTLRFELREDGSVSTRLTFADPLIFFWALVAGTLGATVGFLGGVLLVFMRFLRRRARAIDTQPQRARGT